MAVSRHAGAVHELQVHVAGDDRQVRLGDAGRRLRRQPVRAQQVHEQLQRRLPALGLAQQDDSCQRQTSSEELRFLLIVISKCLKSAGNWKPSVLAMEATYLLSSEDLSQHILQPPARRNTEMFG